MPAAEMYCVVILPQGEVIVENCTLREAQAYVKGYNQVMRDLGREAVIAEARAERKAA